MARPGQAGLGAVEQQHERDGRGGDHVERRHERVAEGAVGALGVGPLAAQHEEAGDGQHVEDEHREDHPVEQLAVEVAVDRLAGVGSSTGRAVRIVDAGARQHEQAGPRCTARARRERRHVPHVELAGLRKNSAVLRHRVVDPRAGEDQAVVAAEGGDDDRHRHDRRARRPEDHRQRCGRHAVVGRGADLLERQRAEVGDVGEHVEHGHQQRAVGERERDVALAGSSPRRR